MKKYYHCFVKRKDGSTFINPLQISELRLLSKLLKENQSVLIVEIECSKEQFAALFGS